MRNAYDHFFNPGEMRQLPNQVPASIMGINILLRKKKKSTQLYAVQSPSGQGVPKITGTQSPPFGVAISGTPQPSSTTVEPSIIEHVLLLNTFQYFPPSLIKLSDFCVIGCTNWRVTNVLWTSEIRKGTQEEVWVIVCFNFFLNSFWPLSSSSPLSSSFLVCFEELKNLMGASTRALQNFFIFHRQRCNNQRF